MVCAGGYKNLNMKTKNFDELRTGLIDWEADVINAVKLELIRISGHVKIADLPANPFRSGISMYVETIYLDEDGRVILDTSFADVASKALIGFLHEEELDSWGLLDLLAGLSAITT